MWKRISITLVILMVAGLVSGAWYLSIGGGNAGTDTPQAKQVVPAIKDQFGVLYPTGVNDQLFGKAATLSISAFDKESNANSQVAATAYVWTAKWDTTTGTHGDFTYLGSYTLNATGRYIVSGSVTVGDLVKVIAFDGTYKYGTEQQFTVTQTSELTNLDTFKGSTSQTVTWFDQNGVAITNPTTTGNISVSTVPYQFDRLRITNTADQTRLVPKVLAFAYSTPTNISRIGVSGLSPYTTKIKRITNVQDMYVFSPGVLDNANTKAETGTVTVYPTGNNVQSETVTAYVIDVAPFLGVKNDLQYGIQDDSINQNDVGVADVSQGILLI